MAECEQFIYGASVEITRKQVERFYKAVYRMPRLVLNWRTYLPSWSAHQERNFQQHLAKWYSEQLGIPMKALRMLDAKLEGIVSADIKNVASSIVLQMLDAKPSRLHGFFVYCENTLRYYPTLFEISTDGRTRDGKVYALYLKKDDSRPDLQHPLSSFSKKRQDIKVYRRMRKRLVEIVHSFDIDSAKIRL